MCKKNKKLKKNFFQVTTNAFQASIGKRASCRNRKKKEQNLPKSVFGDKFSIIGHDFDKFALIPLMLVMLSFCVICHLRRQIRCPVRSQSHYCRRNEYKLNKKGDFRRNYPLFDNCYCHIDTSEFQISGSSSVFS